MHLRHGQPLRGLAGAKKSPLFAGRFGRMFRSLPAATYGSTDPNAAINVENLNALAKAMISEFDGPKDQHDDEESGIPALYTYFGQFVDHDLTFDPASTLQAQNDPDALVDFRTPAFDLDNVYGRGPDDQPYMYEQPASGPVRRFLLGKTITGGSPNATDLPRNAATPARALIGDPRNDENTIVSQLQGLFHRFHNRMVDDNPSLTFAQIQELVRFHYQYVILNDFLPRIVRADILDALKTNRKYDAHKLKFYHWKNEPFMPVEFSVAAYRFGHSMIRPGYRLNDMVLLPIFPVPAQRLSEGLTGFREMISVWGIDWGRFIDIDQRVYDGSDAENKKRLQFAYRIDTALVDPLAELPTAVATDVPSLAARNLVRGLRMGLPSGQAVAKAMSVTPLTDDQIVIGQGIDNKPAPLPSITAISSSFADNCPLWTYVLAEAASKQIGVKLPVVGDVTVTTPQLGDVGGRIVSEVFLGLMFGDANSLLTLSPDWFPPLKKDYKLKDFVLYALGK